MKDWYIPHRMLVNNDMTWFMECKELVVGIVVGIVDVIITGRVHQNIERAGEYTCTTHTLQQSQKSKLGQLRHL